MLPQTKKRMRRKNPRKVVEDFLSAVVEDDCAEMKDRLKASELLSKSAAQEPEQALQLEIHVDYGQG